MSTENKKGNVANSPIGVGGMEYNFRNIEKKWQQRWKETNTYQVSNESDKPKYYVLDMFPYPSGAGLHVGHPLGYIASDIYSRYKRLKGFNVLHPMGFDSFGLPAEQYALDTGQHPAETTKNNISTFKSQLDNIGFCYDWSREVQTSDPNYYKWTQWIFLQLFNSYYNKEEQKAKPIAELVTIFETEGNLKPHTSNFKHFTADDWKNFDDATQQDILMYYRLSFSKFGEVNWCEALGTVLANDEVVNGVSERGGHPVEKKKMRQWYLRITSYADRLLEGLETVDFSDSMKEMQRNWIGKSQGAEMDFKIVSRQMSDEKAPFTTYHSPLTVYTTRPDTIFGVDFMVVAPEHELVEEITTVEQKEEIEKYLYYVKSRSDRERQAEVKQITGCFTGSYAINPFDGRQIPIWIAEYVLAGYGTGAIMAVPCGDQRDFAFAKHFNIPITNIIGEHYNGEEANPTKEATLQNSGFLNGMLMKDAIGVAIKKIEELGIGTKKVNFKMRDAGFSRQRYWGEPFPIIWSNGIALPLDENKLPLTLPEVKVYSPGPNGEGPLANIKDWLNQFESENPPAGGRGALETSTMPGYAGSSWYFLRYMDPHNTETFCDRKVSDYWNQVDLYIGGTEHAVGHLLYSRMWTKVLFDLGYIGFDEPFKKLLNQGMIQGSSRFVYRMNIDYGHKNDIHPQIFVSSILNKSYEIQGLLKSDVNFLSKLYTELNGKEPNGIPRFLSFSRLHVDVSIVDGFNLDVEKFRKWKPEFENAHFILTDGVLWTDESKENPVTEGEVEKMSKSKFNTVNPDELVYKYGADTFRMYEMFLGPVEMSKPWDTKGIEGVHRFLKKFWRLFADEVKGLIVTDEEPTAAELKVLHNTIRKIEQDTERFSFNTAVSGFMIATNELADLKCHKRKILEPLLILLAPYAPHIAEELYAQLRHSPSPQSGEGRGEVSVLNASYPKFEEKYVKESTKAYPVAINGKTRHELTLALDITQQEVEAIVLKDEVVQKWLEGKAPKKIIYVKNKMINVVI